MLIETIWHDIETCDNQINFQSGTPEDMAGWECCGCGEVFETYPENHPDVNVDIDNTAPDYPSFESGYWS